MMSFPNRVFLLLTLIKCVWGKCIFDEVQRSVRVLSPPDNHPNPSDWSFRDDVKVEASGNEQKDWLPHVQIQNYRKETSHYAQSQRSKRAVGRQIKVIAEPQPIRIKTWIAPQSPVLLQWETERLEAALNDAISTVSKLLAVRRVSRKLLLNRDMNKFCRFIWRNSTSANFNKCGRAHDNYRTESCLGLTIPDDHLSGCVVYPHPDQPDLKVIKPDGAGLPDTDVVVYMTAQSTDKCRADSGVLAYSAHCRSNPEGRPIAGAMVICRESISMEGFSHEHMVQTVIHELLHVLGFSKDLFSKWRDRSFSSQMDTDSSHGQVIYTDESGQMRLYTPNVNKALHTHLNSTHTELGVPLENQDADSHGFSSHWEARVLQGSIMTSTLAEPTLVRIDIITLSAFQDTGWYSVNLSQAQDLLWGQSEGASFGSVLTCKSSSPFFCTGSGFGCHYLHLHKGVCQTDKYLDGCRMYKPLANGSECWKEENETGSVPEVLSGEIFGSDSRCFLSAMIRADHFSIKNVSVSGRCYRHRCTGKNRYQIQVKGSDWLDCPPGRSIEVFGYRGEVFCPDKRLCYYHDIIPPTSLHRPLPLFLLSTAAPSSNQSLTQTPITGLWLDSAPSISEMSVMIVVGVVAVFVFLGSLMIIYRKCRPYRIRVHALIQSPHTPHV